LLKTFISNWQVSEVGSIRAGSTRPDQGMTRYKSSPRLNGQHQMSRAPSSAMISVRNVEPLTRAHLRKHDARERVENPSRNFVAARQAQENPQIRPTISKSHISPRHRDRSSSPPERAISRLSRSVPSRQSRSGTPNLLNTDDQQSVIACGVDVDYVNANVESVSTVGHNRRKDFQAANDAAKVTKPSLILPETYKSGAVPKYLKNRQVII